MPVVTVIVLNYNGARWIPGCMNALASQVGAPSFETVVVDNGSSDESIALTRNSYPTAKLVEAGTNLGFAGGNNTGARVATGEWLAFLNNDTVVDPAWLARLWDAARAHPDFALITSRIVFLHDPSTIDSAGDGYLRAGAAYKHGHGAPAASFAASHEVFGACGAAFMIRREAFEALGGFDERFFAVYEDVDLSYRARLRGYRCQYVPDAVVRHHGSATIGSISRLAVFYGQRNLEWVFLKNTPASLLIRTLPGHLVYNAAAAAHFARLGLLGTFLRAKAAALRGVPAALRKRAEVQRTSMVGAAGIEPLLERRWLAAKVREKRFDVGLTEAR